MKQARPDLQAMDAVFPQIKKSTWREYAQQSALALCLAADSRFEEALSVLQEIEIAMEQTKEIAQNSEEWQFHPLHKAWILFYESKDIEAARSALQTYMDRFPEAPGLVLNRALDFIYCLENNEENLKKIANITDFLLNSKIMKDPSIRESLPRDRVASVYDMHAQSLAWRGQFKESADYKQIAMNEYPDTLAGGNCAMNYARFIGWSQNDIEGAETIYRGLLEENRHESLMPWVKLSLSELLLKRNDIRGALLLTEEVLKQEYSLESESGSRLRNDAFKLNEQIKNYQNGQR
jgi:hypothetical protein